MLASLAVLFGLVAFLHAASFNDTDRKSKYTLSDSYVTINTLFFSRNLGVSTQEIDYWKVSICTDQPDSGWIQVLINVPANPIMNITNHGWPVVELGTSSTSFTSSTVFATNYVWGYSASSTIQVQYDVTNFVSRTFYIRVTSKTFSTTYGLQVKLLSTSTTKTGSYDSRAFPTQNVQGAFQFLDQYGTTGTVPATVGNLDSAYYFVKFCNSDILNPSSAYHVNIQLVADPSKPRSAFNVYACPASTFVMTSCTNFFYAVADEETAPVGSVSLTNSVSQPLSSGIWILVAGEGGELDSKNNFFLSAKLEDQ